MRRCTANNKVFDSTRQTHNGGSLVTGVVELFAGTVAQTGIWKASAPKELCDRNGGRTDRVNDMVASVRCRYWQLLSHLGTELVY